MLSDNSNHRHHNHHPENRSSPERIQGEEPTPPPPRVLTILSHILEKLVARNDQLVLSRHHHHPQQKWTMNHNGFHRGGGGGGKTCLKGFDGVRAPSISIPKYLERIYKYTECSPACFVVGYVYLDRLIHKYPDSLVVSLNIHRLLVTCVMVASKMLDDVHYNNAFFARVGGITNSELNRLELELLFLLDFGVMVSSRIFETYCQHLEKEMLRNGGTKLIIDSTVRPPPAAAITSSCAADATEISVEDHTALSSSSHEQILD